MRVQLPNGTIIEGVPEGTTKDQIMQKAISRSDERRVGKGWREGSERGRNNGGCGKNQTPTKTNK